MIYIYTYNWTYKTLNGLVLAPTWVSAVVSGSKNRHRAPLEELHSNLIDRSKSAPASIVEEGLT